MKDAERLMGKLNRSENSLNQHIKNKHKELWETIKARFEGQEGKCNDNGEQIADAYNGKSEDDSESDDRDEERNVDFVNND